MQRKYSDEVQAKVMQLRRDGLTMRAIGLQVGATENQIGNLIRRLDGRNTRIYGKNKATSELMKNGPRVEVPERVLVDRDRRLQAPRTISMALFGDPVVPRWNSNAQ